MLDHPLSNDSNKVRVCPQIESEVSGEQSRLGYDVNAAAISTRVFTRNNPQDKFQLFVLVFLAHGQNLLDESCDAFGSMKTPTFRRHESSESSLISKNILREGLPCAITSIQCTFRG